jgi:hypothetical protein
MAPAATGHRSLIIRIIAFHFGDHSLKLQGFIGIVALQGLSGLYSDRIDTVPYSLYTFDWVLHKTPLILLDSGKPVNGVFPTSAF